MLYIRPGRSLAALATLALTATCLAGCGDGSTDDEPSSASSTPPTSPQASYPPTTLPTATAPGDVKTTTTTSALPVPSAGPTGVSKFPVPEGVKVKGPAPQAKSWQFDITTKDTGSVLAFYRKALAEQGYLVRNDVNEKIGIEKVHYDIAFSGPAQGYIVADPTADDVFVLVQSLPTAD